MDRLKNYLTPKNIAIALLSVGAIVGLYFIIQKAQSKTGPTTGGLTDGTITTTPMAIPSFTIRPVMSFPPNGLTGRFVVVARVKQELKNVIQLREIEVYTPSGARYVPENAPPSSDIIPIPMKAYASSVLDDNVEASGPQRLIDGSASMWDAASTKFDDDKKQYLFVDLKENRNIGKIIIRSYALNDSIGDYIRGCQVQVFDSNFGFVWAGPVITDRGNNNFIYPTPTTTQATL